MGISRGRPPLPAPTDDPTDNSVMVAGHMDDSATDVATNLSRRTDATSYTVPEDGRAITVPVGKTTNLLAHGRNKSQTSLMIEYFEGGKGEHGNGRPSVRVKVTPSSKRRHKSGHSDAVQITELGKDRKPSYTRRISLGPKQDMFSSPLEGTEISHSSESNLSSRPPPVDIEILQNGSDLSNNQSRLSRDLHYVTNPSDISSMPPDSLLEAAEFGERSHSPLIEQEAKAAIDEHLSAPDDRDRARSISRERITQKVMEKLKQRAEEKPVEYEPDTKPTKERRRRTSKSNLTNTESVSSGNAPSQTSYRSGGTSKVSLNNPRLLEMVEDTVRRLILPEIDQLKSQKRMDRKVQDSADGSVTESHDSHDKDSVRRLSKSSTSPSFTSKPKVVLNRYDDQPGEVLSRGDSERKSERKKHRKSSRESVPQAERSERRSSKSESHESLHLKSSRDSHRLRDAAVVGVAGGVLTAAALRHHDSGDLDDKTKRKTQPKAKSHDRSNRSASIEDHSVHENRKQDIPPMPFASAINESDITRTSLLSEVTERSDSRRSDEYHTPLREVSRYSLDNGSTPSSETPTQTPRHLRSQSVEQGSPRSPASPQSISTKARIAALAAAGLGAAKFEQDRYERPASNASSTKLHHDSLIPEGLSPRSKPSRFSRDADRNSNRSTETAREIRHERKDTLLRQSYDDPATPRAEDIEEWFEKQHKENDRYRQSIAGSSVDDSLEDRHHARYLEHSSNGAGSPEFDVRGISAHPQIVHEPHDAESSVASLLEPSMLSSSIRSLTGTPGAGNRVEIEQHNVTAVDIGKGSSAPQPVSITEDPEHDSPVRTRWSLLREQAEALSAKKSTSRESESIDTHNHHAVSPRENHNLNKPVSVEMGVSALPSPDDHIPEIGHGLDNISEISTNPTEIQGTKPKGHKERWSYDTDGFLKDHTQLANIPSPSSGRGAKAALLGAAIGSGYLLSGKASPIDVSHRASVEEQYNRGPTPDVHQAEAVYMERPPLNSPGLQHGDEGYSSAAHARSAGEITPKTPHAQAFTKVQLAEYEAAMAPFEDPFLGSGAKQSRHYIAKSHGLTSSQHDGTTGRTVERIQSEDVVALMDHLTVRDAQRNARDTEILVTLVRSAAEMRQEFDALRKFIAEEDRLIMQNTDRDAELTVQKVLSGPRPMPGGLPPRSPRGNYDNEEYATKRKNIFKRALKGLSSRSNNDLGRIEDMLNQLLGDVEVLKGSQRIGRPSTSGSMDSYDTYNERRTVPGSGYEPEGRAGTSSTPNQSKSQLSPLPSNDKQFHSGYDGRRGSVNRVSTVAEADEDKSTLDPHEAKLLDDDRFEENPRLLTPTQERYDRDGSPGTPTQEHFKRNREVTIEELTPDKQAKHKSNSSSLFGIPKLSRWSKTTASTEPENKRKSNQSYQTYHSKSGDSLGDEYHKNGLYTLNSDDKLRSTQSLVREQNRETDSRRGSRSTLARSPSPLMPSETGSQTHDRHREPLMSGGAGPASSTDELRKENLQRLAQYDDMNEADAISLEEAQFQAHRNSLLLEHPQPRPGPTHRHQTNLETQARTFSGEMDVPSGLTDSDVSAKTTDSDFDPAQWGSNPAISLARTHKIATAAAPPKDDGPLIPQVRPSARQQQQEREATETKRIEEEKERNRPKHAYDRMYYSSPLGSGHLLEAIPEVRYSLETDSHSLRSAGHRSPDPSARPSVATNGPSSPTAARKITGPRPMSDTRRTSKEVDDNNRPRSGTVRRKPVAGSKGKIVDEEEDESGWGTWKGKKQH